MGEKGKNRGQIAQISHITQDSMRLPHIRLQLFALTPRAKRGSLVYSLFTQNVHRVMLNCNGNENGNKICQWLFVRNPYLLVIAFYAGSSLFMNFL